MKNLEGVETVGLSFRTSVTGLISWEEEERDKETKKRGRVLEGYSITLYIIPALEQVSNIMHIISRSVIFFNSHMFYCSKPCKQSAVLQYF